MSEDPRCCGSGTCIIDREGRCWCGQQWDGQKMCTPDLQAPTALADNPQTASHAPTRTPGHLAAVVTGLLMGLTGGLHIPTQAQQSQAPSTVTPVTPISPAEAHAIRLVIDKQLAAFAAGDAKAAFAYASTSIRRQFGSAENFMDMVHAGYPMVVRPTAVTFFAPQAIEGAVLQRVQLRDADGRLWLALYDLVQEPSNHAGEPNKLPSPTAWLIAGCQVRPAPAQQQA